MKILAIGNSFSQDATALLNGMAAHRALETKVVNLFIGGCSLYTHWKNMISGAPDYAYELNGRYSGRQVSIREALREENWDVVTMQQASHDSGLPGTYFPHIAELSGYIRQYAPGAEQRIHQTWAYEMDSDHEAFALYGRSQTVMYGALKAAYASASETLGLKLIPCGDVIQALRKLPIFDYANGGQSLCRDGFHLHLVYGRYAAAATWYASVLKEDILLNDYRPPEADAAAIPLLEQIRRTVADICSQS